MSSLLEHAERELNIIQEDADVVAWYLKVVSAFAEFGHSGASAEYTLQVLERLLRFQNLAPLTSAPEEWIDRSAMSSGPLWQSLRNPEYFSKDGGQTFYSLAELEMAEQAKKNVDKRNQSRLASAKGHNKRMKKKKKR